VPGNNEKRRSPTPTSVPEESRLTAEPTLLPGVPAPLPRRAAAAMLDVLVVLAWCTMAGMLASSFDSGDQPGEWPARLASLGTLAYMVLGWGIWGSSVGKAALGLRIVRKDGRPMTLSAGAWRVACYLLVSIPAKLGLVAAVWHPQRRGWHDLLAGTIVVQAGKVRELAPPSSCQLEEPPSPTPYHRRWAAVALALYVVLAVVFTWPLAAHLGTCIPGGEILGLSEDSYVFLWDYWWVRHALQAGQPIMHTNYIFWPLTVSLRFHTLMPLNGVLSSLPQGWIGLIPTYNLLLLFALVASAWACYGLALMVTRSAGASMLAGGVFAFSPYMMTHTLSHPNLTAVYAMPLIAWFLVKAAQSHRWPWALGAGAALGLLGYCDWYGFMFGGMLAAFLAAGLAMRPEQRRAALAGLGITLLVGVLIAAPLLVPMLAEQASDRYAVRPLARSVALAGDPVLWVTPPFLGTLAGGLGRRAVLGMGYLVAEHTVYLGSAALVLAALGWQRRRRDLVPWAVGAVGMLLLSLGPYLRVAGHDGFPALLVLLLGGLPGNGFDLPLGSDLASRLGLGLVAGVPQVLLGGEKIWLPYQWLWRWVPMLKTASVPVRMAQPALLCLAVMAATGLAALWRAGGRARWWLALGFAAWAFLEFLPLPYPTRTLRVSPFYRSLARDRSCHAICETPLTADLGSFQFYQTIHEKRLLAGHISRPPSEAFDYIKANSLLRDLVLLQPMLPGRDRLPLTARLAGLDDSQVAARYRPGIAALRQAQVGYLVVHPRLLSPGDLAAVSRVMGRLGARVCYRDRALLAYRLPGGGDNAR